MLVIPRTKHIASKMFDFPLPLSPVIELKLSSLQDESARDRDGSVVQTCHPVITVLTAYDLKPCEIVSLRSEEPG